MTVLLSSGWCGCSNPPESPPRLVILYATCSLNRDYLSPYQPGLTCTPNLEQFAKEGIVFRHHLTEAGQSGVAFASLFSGSQAPRHGVFYHPNKIQDSTYLISEAFADAGFTTYFWSGHSMASYQLGYGQGVQEERATERKPGQRVTLSQLTATDEKFDALLDSLTQNPTEKTFVQVNFTLTHHPYHRRLDPETLSRFHNACPELVPDLDDTQLKNSLAIYLENQFGLQWNFPETVANLGLSPAELEQLANTLKYYYHASVFQLDEAFGKLIGKIKEKGLRDESLIAFTADHGEVLDRDTALFKWSHGMQLAPEVLQVPLIIAGKGIRSGEYQGITRSIDMFPTLTGLAGIYENIDSVEGSDLSAAIRQDAPEPKLIGYAHTALLSQQQYEKLPGMTLRNSLFPEPNPAHVWTLARSENLAYKRRRLADGSWVIQVFDWGKDPEEIRDLFDPENEKHREMARKLEDYHHLLRQSYSRKTGLQEEGLSEKEMIERLKDLGYVK